MSVISKSNPVQLQQIKYFVSCVNTLVGQAIVEQVRNDHLNDINPHIIIGTKSSKNIGPVPQSVKRIINSSDPGTLTKALIDSDVIIYDLNSAKLDEVEYAIKVLRMSNFESEKTLILISSVMVWSNTPPKEKKDGDEEDESVAHEEGEDPSFNAGIPSIAYREKDYARRRPSPKYEIFKTLETQCLGAGNIKKNLSTYVLCAGILYGNGEETFAEYFKQAWLQNPEALSYIGEGRNIIPTIHVKDLAMYVNFVVLKRPATRYIFAIDHGKNQSLKNIVQAISSGLGTGKVKPVSVLQAINDPYLEVFKLNIKLCPSNVVELQEGEEDHGLEEIDETDEEVERLTAPRFRFTWWCKDGLKKNIEKVVNEYNSYRGLKQVRIFMAGPPAGGKTYFGTRLSQIYNVPHLLIAEAVREVQEMQNDFGNEIRTLLAEMKAQMVAEAEAQLEELKKKKKKGQPDPVVDPDKIIPRLPDHLLLKVYKYVLEKNDCYNRGFVLDGFPKTYEQAKTLFTVPAAPKEGEEAAGEQAQAIELDPRKVPEFVIRFEAPDDFLKARVKGLPEDQVAGTHYNEEGMVRRLAGYTKLHTADGINPVLMSFFEEHGIDVLKVKYENNVTNEQILETMKQFIEKNGKFKNFQDAELIEELRRKRKQREEQEIEAKKQEELRKQQEEKEKKEKQLHEEEARKKLEGIKENEKKLLDERSQPLRQYLADMVVPTLTTGLIEICKEKPNDPVEFLIEYLMKKSAEVIKPPETTTQK